MQVKALNCPNCGASIPDTSTACSHCGSKVILSDDRMKFVLAGKLCPKCGTDNKEANRYCSSCGIALFKTCRNLDCRKEIYLSDIHCPYCGYSEEDAEIEIANRPIRNKIQGCKDEIDRKTSQINDLLKIKNGAPSAGWGVGCLVLFVIPAWLLCLGATISAIIADPQVFIHQPMSLVTAGGLLLFLLLITWIFIWWFFLLPKKELNNRKNEIAELEKAISRLKEESNVYKNQLQPYSGAFMENLKRRFLAQR